MSFRVWWSSLSVRNKLLMQSVGLAALALVFTSFLLIGFDQVHQRKSIEQNIHVLAKVVSERSSAAIAFDDVDAAQKNLQSLALQESVQTACLYKMQAPKQNWALLAQYQRQTNATIIKCDENGFRSLSLQPDAIFVQGSYAYVLQPVLLDGEMIGQVVLIANSADQLQRLKMYALIATLIVSVTIILLWVVTNRLVRLILLPLLKLNEAAVSIVYEDNYKIRAIKMNDDELGNVVDSFNAMLDTIESNTTELRDSEEKFRLLSEAAAFGIFQLDESGRAIYANQQLCNMTGFTREYIQNNGFVSAVHHTDKRKIRKLFDELAFATSSQQIEGRLLTPKEEVMWVNLYVAPLKNENGRLTGFIGAVADITTLKLTQEKLGQMAFYDPLTKLANRRLFRAQLEKALLLCKRRAHGLAVLLLDIDLFKNVNDSLGHDVGDELLVELADRIKQCVRASDTVARFGGDEFVILLDDVDSMQMASRVAQLIIDTLSKKIMLAGSTLNVTTSIGIAMAPRDGESEQALLKHADLALYQVKESGRNAYRFYTQEMNSRLESYLLVEKDLRGAIANSEFMLHYQPQIDLHTNKITGFEALIRWQHPTRGLVSPMEFIPVAEQNGMIVEIGRWVMHEASRQLVSMLNKNLLAPTATVAINISAKQLCDETFVDCVEELIAATGIRPMNLELELTESMLMENIEAAAKALAYLKRRGILVSVDDFGTGYSSLSYLKRLPVHLVKIDRSFVKDIPQDQEDMDIVAAIVVMTHRINYKVIAEGIETQAQLDFLRSCNCNLGQGFFISKPLPVDQLESFCADWDRRHQQCEVG